MQHFDKKPEPRNITIAGHILKCPICGNDQFYMREMQVDCEQSNFINFDESNKTATCFICSECTHLHWFLDYQEPEV